MTKESYKYQALTVLKDSFPRVSVAAIREMFNHFEYKFTPTYEFLTSAISQKDLEEAAFLVKKNYIKVFIQKDRDAKRRPYCVSNPTLCSELMTMTVKPRDVIIAHHDDEQRSEDITIECECCFGDFLFEEMNQCSEGHLFCTACICHYVEEQLFGQNKSSFVCMSGEGCLAIYP
jgi:TRIAD3 protein (E3 ubiquitin-protein ligase RNF216)